MDRSDFQFRVIELNLLIVRSVADQQANTASPSDAHLPALEQAPQFFERSLVPAPATGWLGRESRWQYGSN